MFENCFPRGQRHEPRTARRSYSDNESLSQRISKAKPPPNENDILNILQGPHAKLHTDENSIIFVPKNNTRIMCKHDQTTKFISPYFASQKFNVPITAVASLTQSHIAVGFMDNTVSIFNHTPTSNRKIYSFHIPHEPASLFCCNRSQNDTPPGEGITSMIPLYEGKAMAFSSKNTRVFYLCNPETRDQRHIQHDDRSTPHRGVCLAKLSNNYVISWSPGGKLIHIWNLNSLGRFYYAPLRTLCCPGPYFLRGLAVLPDDRLALTLSNGPAQKEPGTETPFQIWNLNYADRDTVECDWILRIPQHLDTQQNDAEIIKNSRDTSLGSLASDNMCLWTSGNLPFHNNTLYFGTSPSGKDIFRLQGGLGFADEWVI